LMITKIFLKLQENKQKIAVFFICLKEEKHKKTN
jgi:hypothetical protein